MKLAIPKTEKKASPLVVLAGLAVVLIFGYLVTRDAGQLPEATHEPFDSEVYRNSDEFKAKHPTRDQPPNQKNLQEEDKQPGAIQPLVSSGLPEHMDSTIKTVTDEDRSWPFDPPTRLGDKDRVSQVTEALRGVKDIELDINVYDLGLVRRIRVDENGNVELGIIFTSLFCPYSEVLKNKMKDSVRDLKWCDTLVVTVDVQKVWSRKLLTPEGRQGFKEIFGW